MLHDLLWQANRDLAEGCLEHPFVRGLADGALPRAAFKGYVAQDAFFLRAFTRAYALALARSAHFDHARTLYEMIGGALYELRLHAAYAQDLGIDLDRVTPLPATSAYVNFLLRMAWHTGPAATVAAMTPCMRLYAWLGQQLARRAAADTPYRAWIETYSSDTFEGLARRIEDLLDAVAEDGPAVRDAYRTALQCELDFFATAGDTCP